MFEILHRSISPMFNYIGSIVEAGMVATFAGNRTVRICGPYDLPIGFFINSNPPQMHESVSPNGQLSVAIGSGEYVTDVREESIYSINDLLYCGINGRMTNNTIYRGNPIIGIINSVIGNEIGFIGIFGNMESIVKQEDQDQINSQNVSESVQKSDNKFNRYTALTKDKE